jgi:hypothetical protein
LTGHNPRHATSATQATPVTQATAAAQTEAQSVPATLPLFTSNLGDLKFTFGLISPNFFLFLPFRRLFSLHDQHVPILLRFDMNILSKTYVPSFPLFCLQ